MLMADDGKFDLTSFGISMPAQGSRLIPVIIGSTVWSYWSTSYQVAILKIAFSETSFPFYRCANMAFMEIAIRLSTTTWSDILHAIPAISSMMQ